jgi:hypothetical protein
MKWVFVWCTKGWSEVVREYAGFLSRVIYIEAEGTGILHIGLG